jgi:protein-S-isoprenylcysteine O-methyltransferase
MNVDRVPPSSARASLLHTPLPLAVIIGSIVVLAATGNFFRASAIVIAAQALGIGLTIWSRVSLATAFRVGAAPAAHGIIRRGPYRLVRHPMYFGMLIFLWAGILSHASVATFAVGIALTAMVTARIVSEERLLLATYPDYAAYRHTTKALVPFVV